MPDFTIETTYHLPVFRHRTYAAETLEAACRTAMDDDNWDIAEKDYDSSGPVHITGIWDGTHAAYPRSWKSTTGSWEICTSSFVTSPFATRSSCRMGAIKTSSRRPSWRDWTRSWEPLIQSVMLLSSDRQPLSPT